MFIQREKNVMLWGTTLALSVGILLGGGAARAKNQACSQSQTLPGYCLNESPRMRVAQGMLGGAFASGGALLMIELGKISKR
ncbi:MULTISPECIES: hypothetical protein [Cyanophyceae]|uniref:Uncharacterized protein n=1 Tax=Leptolyngbya subtilissima DQ-A4 TaxID=2933933 RepID=A0ABV0K226_9CYAN|nr:hypothetical protein [Nodosilinea sp. FACHB-141]MBD2112604.1 hypothetical protein [Nodosilinea sp. FACHB-141]